jgi:hypothetical protein
MAVPAMIAPTKAVCQLKKWKDGRKFGAELILRRNVAKFMTKNVIYIRQYASPTAFSD